MKNQIVLILNMLPVENFGIIQLTYDRIGKTHLIILPQSHYCNSLSRGKM